MKNTTLSLSLGLLGLVLAVAVIIHQFSQERVTVAVTPATSQQVTPPTKTPVHKLAKNSVEPNVLADQRSINTTPLDQLTPQLNLFLALDMVPNLEGDATPAQEDAAARDALVLKSQQMTALVDELLAIVEQQPEAYLPLAQVFVNMGDSLVQMPQPAYLSAAQTDQYDRAMQAKAQVQYDKGWAMLEAAQAALPAEHRLQERVTAELDGIRAR